uniref:Uncharacterized protein n=1 Tax=Picea glauca TaxID=3330 RepID=A0A117NIV9_PICGL|nr:hypothetical protein ABT39_MTgene459 [Picea glauca]QHR88180.1 hypothetical protein Q903MT_gene2193 [Picea sitchensis]
MNEIENSLSAYLSLEEREYEGNTMEVVARSLPSTHLLNGWDIQTPHLLGNLEMGML